MRVDPTDGISMSKHQLSSEQAPVRAVVENHVNENKEQSQIPNLDDIAEKLKDATEKIRTIFRGEAQFTVEKELNMIVVKIKDKKTGEIIRQIPPEVALKIAKNLQDLIGILFDERA
ncbi:MAG: flagellar biosynthesis protein FlaG [Thermotogae bacterium]|nr:MAG: flagellar biosynthesis protein FlaG [Thermotogota bacterium]